MEIERDALQVGYRLLDRIIGEGWADLAERSRLQAARSIAAALAWLDTAPLPSESDPAFGAKRLANILSRQGGRQVEGRELAAAAHSRGYPVWRRFSSQGRDNTLVAISEAWVDEQTRAIAWEPAKRFSRPDKPSHATVPDDVMQRAFHVLDGLVAEKFADLESRPRSRTARALAVSLTWIDTAPPPSDDDSPFPARRVASVLSRKRQMGIDSSEIAGAMRSRGHSVWVRTAPTTGEDWTIVTVDRAWLANEARAIGFDPPVPMPYRPDQPRTGT